MNKCASCLFGKTHTLIWWHESSEPHMYTLRIWFTRLTWFYFCCRNMEWGGKEKGPGKELNQNQFLGNRRGKKLTIPQGSRFQPSGCYYRSQGAPHDQIKALNLVTRPFTAPISGLHGNTPERLRVRRSKCHSDWHPLFQRVISLCW